MKPLVAVVSGASSGIGRAIAIQFAKLGYAVVAHGFRNREGLAETVRRLSFPTLDSSDILPPASRDRNSACEIIADISSHEDCCRFVEEAFSWKGYVNVWVNAAGVDVLTGDRKKLSFDEKLDLLWRTDVTGTIRLSRLVAERLIQQVKFADMGSDESTCTDLSSLSTIASRESGLPSIINLSWDQAEQGMEGDSGQFFSAVKAAIAAFSKSLAKTTGPFVRVNCIAPGWIQTEWGKSAPPEWDARARRESALNRWGTPEDIAEVVAMISSPGCEFINGQTISVNGGYQSRRD